MTFKLSDNTKEFYQTNAKLPHEISRALRRGAYISGKQLVADLRADMTSPKSGKSYKVYRGTGGKSLGRARVHKASSSSETPAVISGEFRKSIDFKVRGNRTLEFGSGSEGLAKDYAKILEHGSSKMAARKPIRRTVKKLEQHTKTNITKEVNKAFKKQSFKLNRI